MQKSLIDTGIYNSIMCSKKGVSEHLALLPEAHFIY